MIIIILRRNFMTNKTNVRRRRRRRRNSSMPTLIAILVMLGSATTVSCFVMARNMGHEGVISSTTIMLTTLLSAFTLTLWLYIIKSLGLV